MGSLILKRNVVSFNTYKMNTKHWGKLLIRDLCKATRRTANDSGSRTILCLQGILLWERKRIYKHILYTWIFGLRHLGTLEVRPCRPLHLRPGACLRYASGEFDNHIGTFNLGNTLKRKRYDCYKNPMKDTE